MSLSKRDKHRNKVIVAALATTAALGGGVGVAAAAGGPSAPAPPSTSGSAAEQDEGTEEQEPALNGSVQTEEVAGENEQQEQERLSSQATISQDEAKKAALEAVPGTVGSAELGDENGSLIWEVDITKADGSSVEVKVDAGNGKVLAQEADDQESGEQDEQDEQGEVSTG